jgi:aspartate oxidase
VSDADLIYNALLRAERKLAEWPQHDPTMPDDFARLGFLIIETIRGEVGNGLRKERDANA